MTERYIPKVGDKFTAIPSLEGNQSVVGRELTCLKYHCQDSLLEALGGWYLHTDWYEFFPVEGEQTSPQAASVDATLEQRARTYGSYKFGSVIAQSLKDEMRKAPGFVRLSPYQQYSLEMVQNKVARILNGDPNYVDSWLDIAGYAQLVVDQLNGKST